ncbi:SWI/SNF-related matrix-associated actin-dependent regulator of chromatin subfamily A-like protein [Actinidia chinensis var. chinensis]|uniref:SWI/SNF-related matrix-associated actin-dependent regulator of chromatin subfamily A-like protein n=1 Tax=Actinidia chinensis var. chinensis TaxID=1590841 RepID=A0A2R6RKW7_ACTCC|nr:SWI/SNF-related matrix-associated actin-dependent regulator of chromatin subfamily A-like protein [Actinidia chinensis var. chinensis]
MSHRKSNSQGSVPFSWEDMPGVSKAITTHKESQRDIDLKALNLPPLVLPPPCQTPVQPPRRSTSKKALWQEEDPFLVALKECTKSVKNCRATNCESRNGCVTGFKVSKSKFMNFSCMRSCEVEDDKTVMKLSNLPLLPRERSYWRSIKTRE